MEILQQIVTDPNKITFAALFVGLLVWVIKTDKEREERLINDSKDREDKLQQQNNDRELRYQSTIDKLTESLKDIELIKETVDKINEKLQ